ncbi:Uncharacterised protein [Leminorella grimontii]|nr:Uncharacterised protein [Leminorella grimontii]
MKNEKGTLSDGEDSLIKITDYCSSKTHYKFRINRPGCFYVNGYI